MGHSAFIHGRIEGPYKDAKASAGNAAVLRALGEDEEWPWLDGSMFSIPARWSVGGTRTQLIHFGCSLKDDLGDHGAAWFDRWVNKLTGVLSKLVWYGCCIHLERDAGPFVTMVLVPEFDSQYRVTRIERRRFETVLGSHTKKF